MAGDKVSPRLVLVVTPRPGTADALVRQLRSVNAVVATVVLEPSDAGPVSPSDLADSVAAIQAAGIATLISGDAALARVVKADGVHIPPSKSALAAYREARDILGGRFIVGVDVGRTRHDGMVLGEEGADYIAFGIPAHVEDRDTARKRRLDNRINWLITQALDFGSIVYNDGKIKWSVDYGRPAGQQETRQSDQTATQPWMGWVHVHN